MSKIGISSIIFENKLKIEDGIQLIKKSGFECVDFSICDYSMPGIREEESFLYDDWRSRAENIRMMLDKTGLECNQAHGSWGQSARYDDYHSPDKILFRQIEIASILGADNINFHPVMPKGRVTSSAERKLYIDHTVRWFGELCETAAKFDIGVTVENVYSPYGDSSCDCYFPFCDAETLAEVTDSVGYEKMGICFDTGHANLHLGNGLYDMAKSLGKRIKMLHINENSGRKVIPEGEDQHLFPTGISLSVKRFYEVMKSVGFDGVMSYEVIDRMPDTDSLKKELSLFSGIAGLHKSYL